MRQVFICGYYDYPRGSAAANYVHCLSLAFSDLGYRVILITNVNKYEINNNPINKDILVKPIELPKNKLGHFIYYNYLLSSSMIRNLKRSNPNKDDIVITYSRDIKINKAILDFTSKRDIKNIISIVEWYDYKNYTGKKLKDYIYMTQTIIPRYEYAFPISTYIEGKIKNTGCKTLCLPIMSDPFCYDYKVKEINTIKRFIFPANRKMKDSLATMIASIESLTDEQMSLIEFHISGVEKSIFNDMLSSRMKSKINKHLFCHSWMNYNELINLYQDMDFLLIAREVNEITLANFPSKVPECMNYGIIPVVSRVGDYTKYYLEHMVNSIIFDFCTVESCKEAILTAINLNSDQLSLMSYNARQCSLNSFSYKNWEEKISTFLDNRRT